MSLIQNDLGFFLFAAHDRRVGIGKAEKFAEWEENGKVGLTQPLTYFRDAKRLYLHTNTLAIKLIRNPSIIRFQTEYRVDVDIRPGQSFGNVIERGQKLSCCTLTESGCVCLCSAQLTGADWASTAVQIILLGGIRRLAHSFLWPIRSSPCHTRLPQRFGADLCLHDGGPFLRMGDSVQSLLTE